MPRENQCSRFPGAKHLAARGLVVAIMVLSAAFLFFASGSAKDRPYDPDDFTRVYGFTYDEVFQAAKDAMLRRGIYVREADKEKRIISTVHGGQGLVVHIEPISPKPEVRVTIDVLYAKPPKQPGLSRYQSAKSVFDELSKVLATYQ